MVALDGGELFEPADELEAVFGAGVERIEGDGLREVSLGLGVAARLNKHEPELDGRGGPVGQARGGELEKLGGPVVLPGLGEGLARLVVGERRPGGEGVELGKPGVKRGLVEPGRGGGGVQGEEAAVRRELCPDFREDPLGRVWVALLEAGAGPDLGGVGAGLVELGGEGVELGRDAFGVGESETVCGDEPEQRDRLGALGVEGERLGERGGGVPAVVLVVEQAGLDEADAPREPVDVVAGVLEQAEQGLIVAAIGTG